VAAPAPEATPRSSSVEAMTGGNRCFIRRSFQDLTQVAQFAAAARTPHTGTFSRSPRTRSTGCPTALISATVNRAVRSENGFARTLPDRRPAVRAGTPSHSLVAVRAPAVGGRGASRPPVGSPSAERRARATASRANLPIRSAIVLPSPLRTFVRQRPRPMLVEELADRRMGIPAPALYPEENLHRSAEMNRRPA
jgi:hypothetical protein